MSSPSKSLVYQIAHAHEGSYEQRRQRYAPIAELVRPGEVVVDVGCGDGVFLELIRERGAEGIGIDVDPDKVDVVRRKGFRAYCARVQELDWDWGPVDFVSMLHIVEHFPPDDALEILETTYGMLSEQGRIFIATPNIAHPVVRTNFWLDITHARPYPELLLLNIMDALGFPETQSGQMCRGFDTWCYGLKDPADRVPGRAGRFRNLFRRRGDGLVLGELRPGM